MSISNYLQYIVNVIDVHNITIGYTVLQKKKFLCFLYEISQNWLHLGQKNEYDFKNYILALKF